MAVFLIEKIMTLICKKTNLRAYQHVVKSYLNQKFGKKMQTNTLNTGETGRKSVYIFITLAGFLCFAVSAGLMGSDNPRIQENIEASKASEAQQSIRDRIKEKWEERANEARERKELQNFVDQAEKDQSVALNRQASGSQIASTAKCWIDREQVYSIFSPESNSHKTQ